MRGEFTVRVEVDDDGATFVDIAAQDETGGEGFHMLLDEALEWACAECRVVAFVGDEGLGGLCQRDLQLLGSETLVEVGDLEIDDVADVVLGEWLEEDDLVETVEKFRKWLRNSP